MAHLARYRLNQLEVAPRFEWAPSNRSIADLPTRKANFPPEYWSKGGFTNLRHLYGIIKQAAVALQTGRHISTPKFIDP